MDVPTGTSILNLYKKQGETPLERIDRWRSEHPEYKDVKLSYAGRLDPMAEGVLLILVGDDENRNREKYLMLEKQYMFDVLFGVSTDTYDTLGVISRVGEEISITVEELKKRISEMTGKMQQSYPPFSSRTVKGKPLFEWAREGRLDEISIPTNQIELYKAELVKARTMLRADLKKQITENIGRVNGDFRQKEILELWNDAFKKLPDEHTIYTIRVSCSSGTYIRSLVNALGGQFGCGAIALSIVRERVGEYSIENAQ